MRLGVDFGTTRTVVAIARSGRTPLVSFETTGGFRTWLPTMAAHVDGRWVYADEAEDAIRGGAVGLRSLKRWLSEAAPDEPLALAGAPAVTAAELAVGFLRDVADRLRTRSNAELRDDEPLEAMVAVPANAGSRQRFWTFDAFRRAGFVVQGMINEPSAAAVEFAHRHTKVLSPRSPKRYVVVYDLGGGTFDTAAVSLEGRRFSLLSSDGVRHLGGDDFDEVLLSMWCEEAGVEAQALSPTARTILLEVCREAKEATSTRSRRVLLDPPPGLDMPAAVLDASDVFARCEPLVERTLSSLSSVFARLPETLDPEDPRLLGGLYLVGGAVSFPAVLKALRARYGRKIQLAPEPHAATAIGLAVTADPDAPILVREATTRYFGVWREAEGGRDTRFDPLLRKDRLPEDHGPIVIERRYRPAHSVGHLRYLECSELDAQGRPDGDLTPFGEIHFPYDPQLSTRADVASVPVQRDPSLATQTIVERYTYGRDGTVRVVIENQTAAYRREVVLDATL